MFSYWLFGQVELWLPKTCPNEKFKEQTPMFFFYREFCLISEVWKRYSSFMDSLDQDVSLGFSAYILVKNPLL